MKNLILITFFLIGFGHFAAQAQFPPPAGQPGSTAIHKDSSAFVAWASRCIVERGLQNIIDTQSDTASAGEAWMATGKSGVNGIVSLGDGGIAILTFDSPIYNGPGWDFAIFENSFSDDFLELAFVEVSADGVNFYRFPATSLTQDSAQTATFGTLDATQINNLAGKYRGGYGTPFDLEELSHLPIDINQITHVKIIDVVGCILPLYATYDFNGNIINDPFPTHFPSGGFDLDAVGVIHGVNASVGSTQNKKPIRVYPNPASSFVNISLGGGMSELSRVTIQDVLGNTVLISETAHLSSNGNWRINTSSLNNNVYFVVIETPTGIHTEKILIINE